MAKLDKDFSYKHAMELTKIALAQNPNANISKESADDVADFIEELAKRLSEMEL